MFQQRLAWEWENSCAVTGIGNRALLRASDIKPWRDSNNEERLDRHNGLLLTPELDAAFDAFLIPFDSVGQIRIAPDFAEADASRLGLRSSDSLQHTRPELEAYLAYPRQ